MLHDVRFVVNDRKGNRNEQADRRHYLFRALNDLASGTFYPENMPAGPGGSTACTYTYDAWSACQSNGTQTRNLLTTSPAGCTGTPVLSQACTLSAYSNGLHLHLWCMGHLSVKRNAAQEPPDIDSRRLHRHACPDTELHTAGAGLRHLQLLRVGRMREQHADQNGDIIVPRRLYRDAHNSVDPDTGLHPDAAGLHHLQLLRMERMQ